MATPPRKPLIDNRFRNVLLSMGACVGLMIAYYMAIGQDRIPPDTEIIYQGCLAAPCQAFRLDVAHDGTVKLLTASGPYRYHISAFALRRILRVFKRQGFLDRDVTAYSAQGGEACELTLHSDHRLIALTHACGTTAPEIAKPVEALETATRFRDIAAGNAAVMRDLQVERAP